MTHTNPAVEQALTHWFEHPDRPVDRVFDSLRQQLNALFLTIHQAEVEVTPDDLDQTWSLPTMITADRPPFFARSAPPGVNVELWPVLQKRHDEIREALALFRAEYAVSAATVAAGLDVDFDDLTD